MDRWPVHDAKARFSELLELCITDGPQIVTRRGTEAAVLVPIRDWQRLMSSTRPTLKELLLSEHARTDDLVPERAHRPRRDAPSLT